jgi:hypothetical protein
MEEQWKSVVGYEGIYIVSNLGRVSSVDRVMVYRDGRAVRYKGVLLAPGKTGDRVTVALCDGTPKSFYVHDLVLTTFKGPCPPGKECCHWDGNGTNNILSNLRWDTRSENTYDRVRHGTHHAKNRETCPAGHLLQLPNLVRGPWEAYSRRSCLACACARSNQKYAQKHDMPFDWNKEILYQYDRIMGLNQVLNPHKRTNCTLGHLLQEPNIRLDRVGTCLACNRASAIKSTAIKAGKPFNFKEIADQYYTGIMQYGPKYDLRRRNQCPIEHLLQIPNLRPDQLAKGEKTCLACSRASSNKSYAIKIGKPFNFKEAADKHYRKIMDLKEST